MARRFTNTSKVNADGELMSEEAVLRAVTELTRSVKPMSASGGWFPIAIIAQHAGFEPGTAALRLRGLESKGLVESKPGEHNVLKWRARCIES